MAERANATVPESKLQSTNFDNTLMKFIHDKTLTICLNKLWCTGPNMIGEASYGDYQEEEKTEKDSESQQEVAAGDQGNAEQDQKLTGRYAEKQIVKDLTSDSATDERNPEQIFVETAMTAKAAMDRLAGTKAQTKGEQWNELEKLGIIRTSQTA